MSSSVRIKTLAGSLVLDLSSTGYEIVKDGVSLPKAKARRRTVSSPWVDGTGYNGFTLDEDTLEVTVRMYATNTATVEGLYEDLLTAVLVGEYSVEVETDGVSRTYRAQVADVDPGVLQTSQLLGFLRVASLSIPVQPTPTVTGV